MLFLKSNTFLSCQLTAVLSFVLFLFTGCEKVDAPVVDVRLLLESDEILLEKEKSMGWRLIAHIENLPAGEDDDVIWQSENPRIASVTEEGVVWAEAAGETYVVATLANGKATAKCKVIVTDGNDYKYRIVLKDKGGSNVSLTDYSTVISEKAWKRRQKHGIHLDELDMPISQDYLQRIAEIGGTIVVKSKWLNTVTVHCQDEFLIDEYKELPFVKDVLLVWEGKRPTPVTEKYVDQPQLQNPATEITLFDYGTAAANIAVNKGQYLHENGFKGAGMDIAVIDAGFFELKSNPLFGNVNIKGAKSFVFENDDPYSIDTHGVWVASCMAVNKNGTYVGTAPEANYWLLRTEDSASEYPVEEDYWVAAAEYADSVGVDVINSSLSYTEYYLPGADYSYEQMDGQTAFSSRGANVAASRGILIFNSSGNNYTWVGAPADSPGVVTVGGVFSNSPNFYDASSKGVTVDGRMKPDVMAVGVSASVIGLGGLTENRTGTSYANPIMAGLATCLWQAYPQLTNFELMDVLRQASDRYSNPELPYGYGITNMETAFKLAQRASQD